MISTTVPYFPDLAPAFTTTLTIATGATASAPVDLGSLRLKAIVCPSTLSGTTAQLMACVAGTAYVPIYEEDGDAVTFTIGTSRLVALDPLYYWGVNLVKLVCGTAQETTATFTLVM